MVCTLCGNNVAALTKSYPGLLSACPSAAIIGPRWLPGVRIGQAHLLAAARIRACARSSAVAVSALRDAACIAPGAATTSRGRNTRLSIGADNYRAAISLA